MEQHPSHSRRTFIAQLGLGALAAGAALAGCREGEGDAAPGGLAKGEMTHRVNPKTGGQVSILGYGCMRWPTLGEDGELDQEAINKLVDTAIANGVNYFDTSPAYCKGQSERAVGIALSRHPRDTYFIATKLSNFAQHTWSREKSLEMYHKSFTELQVDTIDYMLLHAVGKSMEEFRARYIDNGMLDFLMQEREAGRIRNLGFSYHGNAQLFDYLLSQHDRYQWDFVQIQMNYLDWRHAEQLNKSNTNAEYLYGELEKRQIPVVIMEPLLGGRLAKLPQGIVARLKQREPERSVASWAFRFAGSHPGVLTVLSGMTYLEHLEDNLLTYSPLKPLTEEEMQFLHQTAELMMQYPTVPCNDCKYCMPCPYGLDIPGILLHYNKCVNEGNVQPDNQTAEYREARRAFLVGYDRAVAKERQADHCIGCGKCVHHCPQNIDIPKELQMIDRYVEQLRRGAGIMEPLVRDVRSEKFSLALSSAAGKTEGFNEPGVQVLMRLLKESPATLRGAWVADKVVGKAAAALMVLGGVRELHAAVISDPALAMLRRTRIRVSYDQRVPEILDGTFKEATAAGEDTSGAGLCPLERACKGSATPEECLPKLQEAVEALKKG